MWPYFEHLPTPSIFLIVGSAQEFSPRDQLHINFTNSHFNFQIGAETQKNTRGHK
jgi:hypothetical protein